eukprot:CAMPEP_0117685564 /NCGR_PEP_ID=MMETSP0804-20121206/21844_1 /TAXON_ID=1074897 /ORGANISM="Tetraselmis astigmatica, Strain CCMP880" /LENGTH=75 /DNA_ID=CAMNT_0005496919 /DNA_START=33 /DNA_END=257 /DNA_ORIENTATION=-
MITSDSALLRDLPSAEEISGRFGLYGATEGTDSQCNLQVGEDGSVRCSCDACKEWKEYLHGRLPAGPPWPQYEVF